MNIGLPDSDVALGIASRHVVRARLWEQNDRDSTGSRCRDRVWHVRCLFSAPRKAACEIRWRSARLAPCGQWLGRSRSAGWAPDWRVPTARSSAGPEERAAVLSVPPHGWVQALGVYMPSGWAFGFRTSCETLRRPRGAAPKRRPLRNLAATIIAMPGKLRSVQADRSSPVAPSSVRCSKRRCFVGSRVSVDNADRPVASLAKEERVVPRGRQIFKLMCGVAAAFWPCFVARALLLDEPLESNIGGFP